MEHFCGEKDIAKYGENRMEISATSSMLL